METSKQANNHGIMVRLGNTNHLFLRGQHRVRDVGGVDASDTSGAHAPCSTMIHVQTTHLYRHPHHCISSLPGHAPPCDHPLQLHRSLSYCSYFHEINLYFLEFTGWQPHLMKRPPFKLTRENWGL